MNWVKLQSLVADPGVIYRVFDCGRCNDTLRYHKVVRLQITKVDTEWLVFFSRKCSGLPANTHHRIARVIRDCGLETREWLSATQWNALVKVDVYSL